MKHKTLSILLAVLMSTTASVVCADEHEYVDLGLPSGTLWATCNVGADKPEAYGNYYAWGETTAKSTYNWSSYKWCNGSDKSITKYCNDSSYGYNGYTDDLTELEHEDDAAYVNWGEDWCMPSTEQFNELLTKCSWIWTTKNGKKGYKITGTNGGAIFLPAAGFLWDSSQHSSSNGYYWSHALWTSPNGSSPLCFNSTEKGVGSFERCGGLCVRPVRNLPKCATPTITYKNGKLTFACDTEGAQFASSITDTDINTYNEAEIDLSVTYTIRVHATHSEYYASEEAVGTLCWIEVEPKSEGVETAVKEISALPVLIQSNNGTLHITGAEDGSPVSVYTTSGQLLGTTTVHGNEATVGTNLHDGIAIVKIGNRAVKVLIK